MEIPGTSLLVLPLQPQRRPQKPVPDEVARLALDRPPPSDFRALEIDWLPEADDAQLAPQVGVVRIHPDGLIVQLDRPRILASLDVQDCPRDTYFREKWIDRLGARHELLCSLEVLGRALDIVVKDLRNS